MDILNIGKGATKLFAGLASNFITKKAHRHIKSVDINDFRIGVNEDGTYKIHVDCYICLTEAQISQLLHNL